jgi:hypothetical protein
LLDPGEAARTSGGLVEPGFEPVAETFRRLMARGRGGALAVRQGDRVLADLARGGHNRILGNGFKRPYDDGTRGQVRHFVGFARATIYGGASPTRWISEHLRNDAAGSPDGRLGDEGIEFTQDLLQGKLELSSASEWLRTRLCRPPKPAA